MVVSEVTQLCDQELHRSLIELRAQLERLSAVESSLVCEWDKRKLWSDDGSKSAASRYCRETGVSPSTAHRVVSRACKLSSMPVVRERFESDGLTADRVDLLTRVWRPGTEDEFVRDEEMLVDNVSKLPFGDCVRFVQYWSAHVDEVGTEDRATKLVEQRSASIAKTFEGSVDIRALFDPVSGEIVLNELERIERELFESDWHAAKELHGEIELTSNDLKRTSAQRRCDALVEMAKRSTCSSGSGRSRPLISVLVGYETFTNRVCELASGTVIAPGQVARLLEKADIERIVFDGSKRVIDIGVRKRFFSGALRRAIEIRDRHCQHESGCEVPAHLCQVDHDHPYSRGGLTTQQNGRLMCDSHNRAKGARVQRPPPRAA